MGHDDVQPTYYAFGSKRSPGSCAGASLTNSISKHIVLGYLKVQEHMLAIASYLCHDVVGYTNVAYEAHAARSAEHCGNTNDSCVVSSSRVHGVVRLQLGRQRRDAAAVLRLLRTNRQIHLLVIKRPWGISRPPASVIVQLLIHQPSFVPFSLERFSVPFPPLGVCTHKPRSVCLLSSRVQIARQRRVAAADSQRQSATRIE